MAKTASQLLMEVLDDFSKSEGSEILIVYTQENDDIVVKTNAKGSHVIGMAEYAKALALDTILKS